MRLAAALLALLLAGTLTACAGGEAAQGPLLLTAAGEQAANERTVRVERGTLVQEFRASASVQSVREVTVYLEAEDAQFVEHRVQNGQRVEEGDVLSVFRKRSDNVRLAEIEVELQGLAAEREDGLYDRDKAEEDRRGAWPGTKRPSASTGRGRGSRRSLRAARWSGSSSCSAWRSGSASSAPSGRGSSRASGI